MSLKERKMKSKMEISFLQINLERSPPAHVLAEKTIDENNIDILITSEPNKNIMDSAGWFTDAKSV